MVLQWLKVGLVMMLLALSILSTAFAWPQPVIDQPVIELNSANIQMGDGRKLTGEDWVAHLPLAYATVVVVLVVNGLFIGKIVSNRRQGKIGG